MTNPYPTGELMHHLAKSEATTPMAEPTGFADSAIRVPEARLDEAIPGQYAETRNRPDWDAAPFFRIFNPAEQQRKFDPNMAYIRKWIPEFGTNYRLSTLDYRLLTTDSRLPTHFLLNIVIVRSMPMVA